MKCQKQGKIATGPDSDMSQRSIVMRILKDQSGASAIEYGLILAMISIALIVSMRGLALGVDAVWDTVTSQVQKAIAATGG